MRAALCVWLTAAALAAAAAAQVPQLSVEQESLRPVLSLSGLLAAAELRDAVQSGLPIRVRVRIELWRDRAFDQLRGAESWSAYIAYRPLEKHFVVTTQGTPRILRSVATFEAARELVESTRTWSVRPGQPGRYYYTAALDVETLSLSDLEELERWLKGELKPAVSGDHSIPDAIGEGAKRLLIRVLALPNRTLELKSERFQKGS